MGLHLCYELSLPADTHPDDVMHAAAMLRDRALGLPFDGVSRVVALDTAALDAAPVRRSFFYRDLEEVVLDHALDMRSEIHHRAIGRGDDDGIVPVPPGTRTEAVAFAIAPGRFSEPATFGVARLALADGPWSGWWWHVCCKTQYASVVSDEYLLTLHSALVTLLEAARDTGWGIEVRDETGYWASRDPEQMFKAVAEMNRMVARLGGAFTDAARKAGMDSTAIGGAIFEHPDFERLESE